MNFKTIFSLAALCAVPILAQLYTPNAQGVTMGHMHLKTRDVANEVFVLGPEEMRIAVYGIPEQAVPLAGTSLSYSRGAATLVGSKGRGIDHIGFEVKNLDAFVKNLEAQGIKMVVGLRRCPEPLIMKSRTSSAELNYRTWGVAP